MKISYFVNSEKSVNWGGQATSAGLKFLIKKQYVNSDIIPLDFGPLPYRNATFLRKFLNKRIANAILQDDLVSLEICLKKMNVDPSSLEGFDAVCFNGEGAVHSKSGHLFRLLGVLYYFIKKGVYVASLNQTVDLSSNKMAQQVLKKVYNAANYVAVREPVSKRELEKLGVNAEVIGDAAYALPILSDEEIQTRVKKYDLPNEFVCITGSSILERSNSSVKYANKLTEIISSAQLEIVFLANTKTDLYLANKVKKVIDIKVIDYRDANYLDAMAIISKAKAVVGGRQHPNIFAAMYHVPFIPLVGNTHKMQGVTELLNYPVPAIRWSELDNVGNLLAEVLTGKIDFSKVTVPKVDSINLG